MPEPANEQAAITLPLGAVETLLALATGANPSSLHDRGVIKQVQREIAQVKAMLAE